jgi:TPP-dependent pyruvate/acetoin dehydrogenase alpha subunit
LQEKLITETEIAEFEKKIEKKIQKSVDFAEVGTWEPMDQLTKFVYSEIRI